MGGTEESGSKGEVRWHSQLASNAVEADLKTTSGTNGLELKLNFVQCASCGGVVGVTDFYNIGTLIRTLAKKMGFFLD
jgi:hypothetical protein